MHTICENKLCRYCFLRHYLYLSPGLREGGRGGSSRSGEGREGNVSSSPYVNFRLLDVYCPETLPTSPTTRQNPPPYLQAAPAEKAAAPAEAKEKKAKKAKK